MLKEADLNNVNVALVLRTTAMAAHTVVPIRFSGSLCQSVIVYRAYAIERSEVDASASAINTASSQSRSHSCNLRLLRLVLILSAAAKALMPSRDRCVDSILNVSG